MLAKSILVLLMLIVTFRVAEAQDAPPAVELAEAFPKLHFNRVLFLTYPNDGSDRIFVIEQDGRVLWFNNDSTVSEPNVAIDIRREVLREHNEEGLLGMAFHPGFPTNHQVFLSYSAKPRRNLVARFTMDDKGETINPASEQLILEVPQPWGNHNGGMIAFAPGKPDKMLYIGRGDGGSAGDPNNSAQRKLNLLGKILRIDVDHKDPGLAYAIPKDNPFVNEPGARGEIWAYGLRNPWRFSFDRQTGDLWAGDVGQNAWEEIDVITKGGNYGWHVREGMHDFTKPEKNAPPATYIEPIAEHPHPESISITGGYVYRGKKIAGLQGWYIYGDFQTGLIWAIKKTGDTYTKPQYLTRNGGIASFGEDRDGEIYITSFDGKIYKFVAGK